MVKNSEDTFIPNISSSSLLGTVLNYSYMAGKTMSTLTHHKKSVRAMAQHPIEYVFFSLLTVDPTFIFPWWLLLSAGF